MAVAIMKIEQIQNQSRIILSDGTKTSGLNLNWPKYHESTMQNYEFQSDEKHREQNKKLKLDMSMLVLTTLYYDCQIL